MLQRSGVQERGARCVEKNYALLRRLNPIFEERSAMLLAQAMIPSLDEDITAMMREKSHMKLHSETKGDVGMRSTLIVSTQV
jgi:hypothetical protein